MKNLIKIASLAVVAVVAVSCIREEASTPSVSLPEAEVGFLLPEDVTRTSLDPDGKTTRWAPGDKLAVWARGVDGSYAFENTQFMLHHYSEEFSKAYFASTIAPMAEGEYTYMLSYPMPNSVNGTLATYTIPTTQTGEYDGRYDIMLAEPVVEGALTVESKVELNTIMRHKMHGIKITVPEGRNLYEQRFYRLEIVFPVPVVGDITIDVSNPSEDPVYVKTSDTVVVESAEGFDAGDDIWIFVLPGTVDGDVSYYVRGERRKSNTATYSLTREMKEGHVTPINMAIPVIYPYYTSLVLSVDQNNLGEDFNFFDVYDSNDNHMGKFERNAKNQYFVDYEGEFDADQYDNTTWRVVFDSDHAIVETSINLGDMTDYTEHARWMNVPYLFYENFSTIKSYSHKRTSAQVAPAEAMTGYDLSATDFGLASGWTGAHTGGNAGSAICVYSRVDEVSILGVGNSTRTYGRLDSPALSSLKEDAVVNVVVSFDYGGGREGNSTYYPVAVCGYITSSGAFNAKAEISKVTSWDNINGATSIPNISTGSTAWTFDKSMSYTIKECDLNYRLSWQVMGLGYNGGVWSTINGIQWLNIDNIKVQISK